MMEKALFEEEELMAQALLNRWLKVERRAIKSHVSLDSKTTGDYIVSKVCLTLKVCIMTGVSSLLFIFHVRAHALNNQVKRDLSSEKSNALIEKIASYWCTFSRVDDHGATYIRATTKRHRIAKPGTRSSTIANSPKPNILSATSLPSRLSRRANQQYRRGYVKDSLKKPRWQQLYETKCSAAQAEKFRQERLWNNFSKHAKKETERWVV
jgi:hypothetical protein